MTPVHDAAQYFGHTAVVVVEDRHGACRDEVRVCLTRQARQVLASLEPGRRDAQRAAFQRVGRELLRRATRVQVPLAWTRRTWPRRHYPQQCYHKTAKYVVDHPDIAGMRLVHGVVSHGIQTLPLDHAWVELPGDVVFDGVVQAFFTRHSYYAVMSAVPLDTYTHSHARQMLRVHRHPGPWNAKWVPTPAHLEAYATSVGQRRAPDETVGRAHQA